MFTLHSLKDSRSRLSPVLLLGLPALGLLFIAAPAFAHHPFGGQAPANALQGFLSGLGHPVIGLDHLAFVVTAGLLAAAMGRDLGIPLGFVLASILGTVLHLMALDLPAPESIIAFSVLLFGGLLAMKRYPQFGIIIMLAELAGIFHGYAYGEAVVGAEMAPLVAYLTGFAAVQMAIATIAYTIANSLKAKSPNPGLMFRFAGFTLAGIGTAFFSSALMG